MLWQLSDILLPMALASLAAFVVMVWLLRKRDAPGAVYLALVAGAAGWWSLFYTLELSLADFPSVLRVAKLQYFGIATAPVFWFLFALRYTGRRFPAWGVAALLALPAVVIAAALGTERHGLLWSEVWLEPGPPARLAQERGPLFWVNIAYSYTLFLLGVGLIAFRLRSFLHRVQLQLLVVMFGALLPFLGNALHVSGIVDSIDLSPFGFGLGATVIAWALYWLRLFDLLPIAREAVIDSMQEGVLVLDRNGRVLDLNPAARGLFPNPGGDPVGQSLQELLRGHDELVALLPPRLSSFRSRIEVGARVLDVRSSPLGPGADPVGRLLVIGDVTAAARSEAELRRAKEAAEAASRAKSQFLSTMSHELRSPLTAVIGYADMLEAEAFGELNDMQKEHVGEILRGGKQLLEIITDVLDFANLEGEKLRPLAERVDATVLAREVAATFAERAERPGRSFRVELPDAPLWIRTDAAKVRRVLVHLLSNAVKFTAEGSVALGLRRDGGEVVFEVRDTGIGIAPEQQGTIFDAFTQVDGGDTRRYGGSGLGLAICRRYSELIGAELELQSASGEGSTFRLRVPAEAQDAPEVTVEGDRVPLP